MKKRTYHKGLRAEYWRSAVDIVNAWYCGIDNQYQKNAIEYSRIFKPELINRYIKTRDTFYTRYPLLISVATKLSQGQTFTKLEAEAVRWFFFHYSWWKSHATQLTSTNSEHFDAAIISVNDIARSGQVKSLDRPAEQATLF